MHCYLKIAWPVPMRFHSGGTDAFQTLLTMHDALGLAQIRQREE